MASQVARIATTASAPAHRYPTLPRGGLDVTGAAPPSIRANSVGSPNRALGSFDIARRIAAVTSGGRSGRSSLTDGGSAATWLAMTA